MLRFLVAVLTLVPVLAVAAAGAPELPRENEKWIAVRADDIEMPHTLKCGA
jgi:hypothetical protein